MTREISIRMWEIPAKPEIIPFCAEDKAVPFTSRIPRTSMVIAINGSAIL